MAPETGRNPETRQNAALKTTNCLIPAADVTVRAFPLNRAKGINNSV
jgi:hypothetical protein